MDCIKLIQRQARAIPIVWVFHPEATVTHEAAIGNVVKKELETLMGPWPHARATSGDEREWNSGVTG